MFQNVNHRSKNAEETIVGGEILIFPLTKKSETAVVKNGIVVV